MAITFLEHFRDWFNKTTDAPAEYCEAAGLYALSTVALSRRWIAGADVIHPNLFLMIVGDSSVARKSTAVKRSRTITAEVEPNRIGPSDYTMEGIYRWMQGKDPGTGKSRTRMALFAGEFGADLARMEAYGATAQADFCHLYDGEAIEKVRTSKTIRIDKPRVNMLAACAYSMLTRHLGPRDWYTGFLMRFLFVAPLKMRPEFTQPPPPAHAEYDACKASLQNMRDTMAASAAGLQIDPAAAQLLDASIAWAKANSTDGGELASIYMARFWTNVRKLALLYQLDANVSSTVIGHDAMRSAVQYAMNICWPSFRTAFERTATRDFSGLFAVVSSVLGAAGSQGVARSELAQRFAGSRDLTDVISWMKQNRMVNVRLVVQPGGSQDEVLVLR